MALCFGKLNSQIPFNTSVSDTVAENNEHKAANVVNITNLQNALSLINTTGSTFYFGRNGANRCNKPGSNHIQGIAYYEGYYYITRSRPNRSNNQQLLIVEESTQKVVEKITLDALRNHPSGIQIHGNILVVPFGKDPLPINILRFYSLDNPTSPALLGEFPEYGGVCAGITDYNGMYLVAIQQTRASMRFCLFDNQFNLVRETTWYSADQDKSNWYPSQNWQGNKYECMSLIKEQQSNSTAPVYYMIMYNYDLESIDVFTLSDPNLTTGIDIQMINRINIYPHKKGFRMSGGIHVEETDRIRFFSTPKFVRNKTLINIFK